MKSSQLTAELLAPLLSSPEAILRAEALRLATARGDWGGSLIGFLRKALYVKDVSPDIAEALLAFEGNSEVQKLLAEALESESLARTIALRVMARSQLETVPKSWESALATELIVKPDYGVVQTVRSLGIRSCDDALLKLATWDQTGLPLKFAALEAIADRLPSPMDQDLFDFAMDCFGREQPVQRRTGAARILARASLNLEQKLVCARELAAEAGPLQLDPLLGVFEKGPGSPEILKALAASLQTSPGIFSVSASRLEAVFAKNPEIAKTIIEKLRTAESQRDQRLKELTSKISSRRGDPERGKLAFVKATCVVCHKARDIGGVTGPELTTIGGIRSERDFLEAIAFPSATFAREYEPYVLTLKDGTRRIGRLGRETKESLELIDAAGQSIRIPTSTIESREMASVSLMPPGLERLLDAGELTDLVAFLKKSEVIDLPLLRLSSRPEDVSQSIRERSFRQSPGSRG